MHILIWFFTFAYTVLPSLACYGNGCGGHYHFRSCTQPICYYGKYIGYGCRHGVCPFVCYGSGCPTTRQAYNQVNPMQLRNSGFYGGWGAGAYGYRGCLGGNCGYWSGCANGQCNGFYDFRRCTTPSCVSGPYHGHACYHGACRYICLQGVCHTPYAYGLDCYGTACDGYYNFPKVECKGKTCGTDQCYGNECDGKNEDRIRGKKEDSE